MPRRKTNGYWRERVRVLAANEHLSSEAIARKLSVEYQRLSEQKDAQETEAHTQKQGVRSPEQEPPPKGRTVRAMLREFESLPAEEIRRYKFFSWPESMASGAVPWEASRACLDFLHWWNVSGRQGYGAVPDAPWDRPTNDMALWFWRITQAAPDAPIGVRFGLLRHFTGDLLRVADRKLPTESWPGIEACLAYRPWASKANSEAYNRDIERDFIPPFPRYFRGQPVPFELWKEPYGPGWPKHSEPKAKKKEHKQK